MVFYKSVSYGNRPSDDVWAYLPTVPISSWRLELLAHPFCLHLGFGPTDMARS